MKRIFIQMLPVMAAILLATSCSKDDGNNSVIDNVVAPQEEPIQDDVKSSVRKTITITGKVSQTSLSKVGVDGMKLTFEVGDEFKISNGKEGNEAISGTITIKSPEGDYEASFSFDENNESAFTSTSFSATLNEHQTGVFEAGEELSDAVKTACYAIDFTVTKNDDGVYEMKSGDASDIVVNIESAFIHPQSSGWITVSGKSYQVTGGMYYIVSNKSRMGVSKTINAGKIYNVSSPATERTVPEGYVDLGIEFDGKKVFWAEKNVGAKDAWDYGDYYAWGETVPYYSSIDPLTWKDGKSNGYTWASYRFANDNGETFTKYTGSDGKSVLESEDDAAYADDTEKKSSIPTKEEWEALANTSNYTWVLTDDYPGSNGVKGYIVYAGTGTHTLFDTHIFLPAAGDCDDINFNYARTDGYYWSSSLFTSYVSVAHYLCFDCEKVYTTNKSVRYCGMSVRAVRRK